MQIFFNNVVKHVTPDTTLRSLGMGDGGIVNNQEKEADYVVRNGDYVKTRNHSLIPSKPLGGPIEVAYINDSGGGYAQNFRTPAGSTVELFAKSISGLSRDDLNSCDIRVNGQGVTAGTVLAHGDALSVIPVDGSVDESGGAISVLLVDNIRGVAKKVAAVKGVTVAQFVAEHGMVPESEAHKYEIRVNSLPVTSTAALGAGDEVRLGDTRARSMDEPLQDSDRVSTTAADGYAGS